MGALRIGVTTGNELCIQWKFTHYKILDTILIEIQFMDDQRTHWLFHEDPHSVHDEHGNATWKV